MESIGRKYNGETIKQVDSMACQTKWHEEGNIALPSTVHGPGVVCIRIIKRLRQRALLYAIIRRALALDLVPVKMTNQYRRPPPYVAIVIVHERSARG